MSEKEFHPAFSMPETPEQAVQMLEAWGNPGTMTFDPKKAAQAARLLKDAKNEQAFRENVEYLLSRCPYTIRVREGGGPESLLDSLIVTFMKMEMLLEKK